LGRIIAIDYGRKRTGIAVTDVMQMIANGLNTVPSHELLTFLENYLKSEQVDEIVVGYPMQMNNTPSEAVRYINPFIKQLVKKFPTTKINTFDERFTSKMAQQAMIDGGMKKSQRQVKGNVDKISAVILLQSYLEHKKTINA